MKHDTKEMIRKSLQDIEESLDESVGAQQLHQHEKMSDEEFRALVHTLSQDIVGEFEKSKDRAFQSGFQDGVKSYDVHLKNAVLNASTQRMSAATDSQAAAQASARAENRLYDRLEELFSLQQQRQRDLNELEEKLMSELRALKTDLADAKFQNTPRSEELESALAEHRSILSRSQAKLDEVSGLQDLVAAKLHEMPAAPSDVSELKEMVQAHAQSLSTLHSSRENDQATLERILLRLEELSAASGKGQAGTSITDENLTNLLLEQSTKFNELNHRLKTFNKKLAAQHKRIEEVYSKSARKGKVDVSLRAVKRLVKTTPKRPTAKRAASKKSASSKSVRTVKTASANRRPVKVTKTVKTVRRASKAPQKLRVSAVLKRLEKKTPKRTGAKRTASKSKSKTSKTQRTSVKKTTRTVAKRRGQFNPVIVVPKTVPSTEVVETTVSKTSIEQ